MDHPEISTQDDPTPSDPLPEIVTTNSDDNTELSSLTSGDIDINFRDGLTGNCILSLLQQAAKDKECMANLNKRKESNKSFYDHMKESKRITAGVVFNAGVVNLVKGGLLDIVKENYNTKNKEILQRIEKELDRFNKRRVKAMKCFNKFKNKHTLLTCPQEIPEDIMTAEDLKTFIMVRKRKTDKAMPKSLQDLKARWNEVKVLSKMNAIEHLLHQGFPRDMIDSVLELRSGAPTNDNIATNFNPLNMLADAAL